MAGPAVYNKGCKAHACVRLRLYTVARITVHPCASFKLPPAEDQESKVSIKCLFHTSQYMPLKHLKNQGCPQFPSIKIYFPFTAWSINKGNILQRIPPTKCIIHLQHLAPLYISLSSLMLGRKLSVK